MARTKEDVVASKADTSPRIPKSAAGVTKNTAEAPAKRGRGRPPKGGPPKVYVPSGRPRGRPKGTTKAKTAPAAPVTKSKRIAAQQNDDGTPKKGRGRPPKSAAPATATSASTTPKKRGRKPKVAVESPVADDVEAEEDLNDAEPGKTSPFSILSKAWYTKRVVADEVDSDKDVPAAADDDAADSPSKDEVDDKDDDLSE
ncbi:hypothetical protein FSARC_3772 [Fusarium sarcochroum]|uniref:AT hook domain-containing protein n=1 Tax=Fusarium sarcochroum TaxID=1208366 RepID=A0A8H4XC30_9HYPO|nr:hypothetical protein FSARC_3772 [Fusarium sarcochroum]